MGRNVKPKTTLLAYELGVLRGQVSYILGPYDEEQIDKMAIACSFDKPIDHTGNNKSWGVCWAIEGNGIAMIWVDTDAEYYQVMDTLVHETSHAVTHLMEHYGFDCDEVRSSMMGFLVGNVIKDTKNLGFK